MDGQESRQIVLGLPALPGSRSFSSFPFIILDPYTSFDGLPLLSRSKMDVISLNGMM